MDFTITKGLKIVDYSCMLAYEFSYGKLLSGYILWAEYDQIQ
jgi:hypothetical protein